MYLFSFLIFFVTQRAKVRQNMPSSALASRTLIPENYLVPSLHFSILYLKENHVYFKEIWAVDLLKERMTWLTTASTWHLRNTANVKVLQECSESLWRFELTAAWLLASWSKVARCHKVYYFIQNCVLGGQLLTLHLHSSSCKNNV